MSHKVEEMAGQEGSWLRAMITGWMLAMAFGAAAFIWFGIAAWEDPGMSITSIGLGIFLVLMSVSRIVRKELENGNGR